MYRNPCFVFKKVLQMADIKRNTNVKNISRGKKIQTERIANGKVVKWPSTSHCVVNFFHPSSNSLDTSKLTQNGGTIIKFITTKKDDKTSITKVEMSTSDEAKAMWKQFSSSPPVGIVTVSPERKFKTLTETENNLQKNFKQKTCFTEYWSKDLVEKGMKNSELIAGALRINSKMFTHSFISDVDGKDILINGLKDRNRALDGDIVAVKLNDESEWIASSATDSNTNIHNNVNNVKSSNGMEKFTFKHARKTGKVVAILEKRNCRVTTGHIKTDIKGLGSDKVLFSPVSSTFPRLILHKSDIKNELAQENLDKVLFLAKIKNWNVYNNMPLGELGEIIGKRGEIETETRRILIEHDVDFSDFSLSVLNSFPHCLEISDAEKSRRRDLTNECIFTIDPSTAKDLDDALHCKEVSPGVYEIGVHIADVSHFVKPGTEVDKIASQRCTSVYLVQKVIPMLPPLLCEELCSLNAGSDKLAFSVIWTINEKGKIISEWIGRSVIRSCAKLSYDHAQSFINDPAQDFASFNSSKAHDEYPDIYCGFTLTDIQKRVLILHKIAQNLRKQRFKAGALQLDQVKLSYTLSDSGMPTGCYAFERKASNELIEEFMLLANMAVAHKIYNSMPSLAFLRCHPQPKEDMMEDLISHCRTIGLEIDASTSHSLSRTIEECCGNDELTTYRKHALFMFAIKPQQLALYFCAGTESDKENYRHYALNVPLYTHFTSPIRRYADVIVHRQLATSLKIADESHLDVPEELQEQAQTCNQRKYNAKISQELSVDLFLNLLVNSYGPFDSNGMIMYVHDRSVDVLSMEYGVVKRVYVDAVPNLMYKLEEEKTASQHCVNVMKLKWTDGPRGDVAYDENAPGLVQKLNVFSLVKIQLVKQEPESAVSIRAVLMKPSASDYAQTMMQPSYCDDAQKMKSSANTLAQC